MFSCKAWAEYQKDYFEGRNETYTYYEYDWMKLIKDKEIEIVTELSGRVKTEEGYIYVRPYGCIEVKQDLRDKFKQEEIEQQVEMILSRYKELVELAKKYIEKGYSILEAIKIAEKELEEE